MQKFFKLPLDVRISFFTVILMMASLCYVLWPIWSTRMDYTFGMITPMFVAFIVYDRKEHIFKYFFDECAQSENSSGFAKLFFNLFFGSMITFSLLVYFLFGFIYFMTKNAGAPIYGMTIGASFAAFALCFFASSQNIHGQIKPIKERLNFVKLFIFPCFIWLISAPLFGAVESFISLKLLAIVAQITCFVMNFLGFSVELKGNVIEFPTGSVGVADACSGIRSLTACIFAGSFLAAAMLDKFWKKIALIALSMVFAFFCNLLRALFLSFWAYENGSESIGGEVHDIAGYAVLGLTVVGLLCFVYLFQINPVPKELREENSKKDKKEKPQE